MDKKERIIESLEREKIDALVCFLPENVLFLSGYWPNTGRSAVLFPVNAAPVLIVPEPDLEFIPPDWQDEILSYGVGLEDPAPNQQVAALLKESMDKRGLSRSRIGCERSFEALAGTHVGGEIMVPGPQLFDLLEKIMPDVKFDCRMKRLRELRMCKTHKEIEALKVCHDIVGHAIGQARNRLHEGMKETEISAMIESAISTYGVGHAGVRRARGFAFAVSGPNTGGVYAWGPYNISTDRVVKQGDLVLVEVDAYADGYWADITRMFVVGGPDQKQKDVMEVILETIDRVKSSLEPGMKASAVNALARKLIQEAGYGDYFPHTIGHGVGFAFHEMPYLIPASHDLLEPGMVLAIEPGIYIPGWGGIRVEDNIVITPEGKTEYLSDFERGF